jgi:enterochelin esterase-like enzyme
MGATLTSSAADQIPKANTSEKPQPGSATQITPPRVATSRLLTQRGTAIELTDPASGSALVGASAGDSRRSSSLDGATVRCVTVTLPYVALAIDQEHVEYEYGPDSFVQPGVPAGRLVEFEWNSSAVYPGTSRKFWVHLPAQYDPAEPASLLVVQDALWHLDLQFPVRAPIVLDNLIHRGDIPATIGVFVEPGIFAGAAEPKNRNEEYDAFDDRYVSFLLDEILPQVTEWYRISHDPDRWAICGGSSGGNCAFTAAWLRPDRFRRVICFNSSFVQMPGGNPYPQLIPSLPRKPLRIFMSASHRDLQWNEPESNWLASNLRVAAALAESGYDFRLVLGEGTHSGNHSGVLFPDALRWALIQRDEH